jgi:hypothetical protein
MPVGVIAAGVGAAGAIGGAVISGNAAQNAANTAANAASQSNQLESQIYGQNKALETPYINAGDTAETQLEGFLGLGGNSQAAQTALNNYLNSTGYQFDLNQGLQSVQQSKAAQGLLGSGSTLKALDQYATNTADQYGQQYEQNLQGVVNTGANAADALAGQGQSYASAVSSNNNSAASTAANAGISSAANTTGLINNTLKSLSGTSGASSFGGGTNAMTGYPIVFNQPGYSSFSGGAAGSLTPGG